MVSASAPGRRPVARRVAAGVLLGACALAGLAGLRTGLSARAEADAPPPPGRSAAWYATYGEAALRAERADWALAAARFETEADPGSSAAWTRRAYAAARVAGRPDREALTAFGAAMDARPFPPAEQIAWRVAFAESAWPAIPDPLAARILTQIEVLEGMNAAWEARVAWCAGSRVERIAEAACATTPGVERGVWLKQAPPAGP